MNLTEGLIYGFIGIFTGTLSGLFGLGGGIIVVPALFYLFQQDSAIAPNHIMRLAVGTSLAIMVFTSESALRAHLQRGSILWSAYRRLWPGLVVGTFCGVLLADSMPTAWFKTILGTFLLFVAAKMIFTQEPSENKPLHFPNNWLNHGLCFFIGCLSSLLGIGGATLLIPYLNHCNLAIKKIAPISVLCTMTLASVGSFMFIITGLMANELPKYSTGFVYWPAVLFVAIPSRYFAPIGAKLNYILPVKQLKYAFIVLVLVTAFKLLGLV